MVKCFQCKPLSSSFNEVREGGGGRGGQTSPFWLLYAHTLLFLGTLRISTLSTGDITINSVNTIFWMEVFTWFSVFWQICQTIMTNTLAGLASPLTVFPIPMWPLNNQYQQHLCMVMGRANQLSCTEIDRHHLKVKTVLMLTFLFFQKMSLSSYIL